MDTKTLSEKAWPLISVVVLNWNGAKDTLACLDSLASLTYPNFDVIVVDNGSTDASLTHLRPYTAPYPLKLLETGRNLGYAGGNNVGTRHALEAGADFVLLLNNDTEVDSGLLDAFVAAAGRFPDAGAFSGKIYLHADPTRIWYAGAAWNAQTALFHHTGEGLIDEGTEYSDAGETAYACGCAFFVPAQRLREVGLLDEIFFLYFEETDWCCRARAVGHPSIFVPGAKLWHKVSVSFGGEGSPMSLYFITRNRQLWASRHAVLKTRLRVYGASFAALVRRFATPIVQAARATPLDTKRWWWAARAAFSDPHNRAYWMGWRDFWLGRFGDCPATVRTLAKKANLPAPVR